MIDPVKEKLNIAHLIIYIFLAFPILFIDASVRPVYFVLLIVYTVIIIINAFKEGRVLSFKETVKTLPDMNIFHIIMFLIIASPFLIFVYYMFAATIENL